jgi:hypothetical protein
MEEKTLNQLKIELDIYKTENKLLSDKLSEDNEKIRKANEILNVFGELELLESRESKNKYIEEEINTIKGAEFFNSKNFKKYGKNADYSFNIDDLTIYDGTKKLATIYDDRFFHFLEKVLGIVYYILDFYRKSAIVLNAQEIIRRLQGNINE